MKEEVIMAGFGGQGIMSMGRLLAYAGMKEGKEVSWMPSYGPEMRGGTANCTVIVSDKKIPSPLSSRPNTVIVMNLPSMLKFAPQVRKNGLIIINSSLVEEEPEREDVEVLRIPANEIAGELGSSKVANMVVLGAYLEKKGFITLKTLRESLQDVLPARRHNLIPMNKKAIARGRDLI